MKMAMYTREGVQTVSADVPREIITNIIETATDLLVIRQVGRRKLPDPDMIKFANESGKLVHFIASADVEWNRKPMESYLFGY